MQLCFLHGPSQLNDSPKCILNEQTLHHRHLFYVCLFPQLHSVGSLRQMSPRTIRICMRAFACIYMTPSSSFCENNFCSKKGERKTNYQEKSLGATTRCRPAPPGAVGRRVQENNRRIAEPHICSNDPPKNSLLGARFFQPRESLFYPHI